MASEFSGPHSGFPIWQRERIDVLSPRMIRIIENLSGDWRRLDERIQHVTEEIEALAYGSGSCWQLMTLPGIGPLNANAMVAAFANGAAFTQGGDFAVWLGLVPKQMSTGVGCRSARWMSEIDAVTAPPPARECQRCGRC
jgi:transposase